ncbi:LysR family transcriptional regulator [Salinisphaera sp.]|uniref:LysR family transcriptional regulator n=1 Tax=Salinisphaera sp. TaxID=1914330 RepID=UPI000C625AD4|nr:LysR family transcriptional regulator [Salinisphaera sp.]MBS62659.1 LysR family transcriptional regulator [Salinisphaera sp.]
MKHFRYFRYMDAVVRAGSIRRAAEQLYITPSALDRRIHDLEKDLGTPLFERHARGMRLLAAGEIFLGYVRRHLADLDRMQSEIESLKGLKRGHVEIVASQAVAVSFLSQQVRTFQQNHPGVTFNVRITDRGEAMRALTAFEADLALVISPLRTAELLPLIVVAQPVMAMMDIDHPLAAAQSLRFGDCLSYPLVLPRATLATRALIDAVLNARSVPATIAVETDSFEMMRGLIAHTANIGFQVAIGTPDAQTDPRVVARPIDERDISAAPMVCAQLKGRSLSVAAARFANQVVGALDAMKQ